MPEKQGKGKVGLALVIGGILGAGIALLFAPQSGRKTRRQLHRLGKKAVNKAEAVKLDLQDSFDNLVTDIAEKLESEVEKGRDWTEERLAGIRKALDAGKSYIGTEIDKIRHG